MKLLSLWEPWASMIRVGLKKWETRGRRCHYRGWVAIQAAKTKGSVDALSIVLDKMEPDFVAAHPLTKADLVFGAIVAVARISDCVPTERAQPDRNEWCAGNYDPGRWAWKLEDIQPLDDPIPCRGSQAMIDVPPDVCEQIRQQVRTGPEIFTPPVALKRQGSLF